ncbi:MAG TPA: flagellar biosynthesis anti-sigma factor FlgM, partial [Stenotrophomonas sp.]|nr:flagellar biosynthesis anti-sigma factor FlgM [Stenotrophomonas sp.]
MSQKIDGNLQVPQALRSVTTPANKPGVSTDAAARPVEAADSLRLTG